MGTCKCGNCECGSSVVFEGMEDAVKANRALDMLDDYVSDYLYYDRKEDFDLPCGEIERLMRDGVLTVEMLTEKFRKLMEQNA